MLRLLFIISLIYCFCKPHLTVAQKICSDTSKRITLFINNDTSLFLIKVIPVGANERLLCGYLHNNSRPFVNSPFIALTDSNHQVIWTKVLPNINPIFFVPTDAISTSNGELIVSFLFGNGGSSLSYIARFDHSGNIMGGFIFNYDAQNNGALNHYLAITIDNHIAVLTKHAEGVSNQKPYYWFSLAKLRLDGSVIWSKAYQAPDDFRENGIVIKNNDIYIQFNYWINNSGYTSNTLRYAHHLMKFDAVTGALKKSKSLFYKEPTTRPSNWGEGNYHYSILSLYNSGPHTISSFSPDWSQQYSITRKNILTYDTSLNVIHSINITDTSGKFLFLSRAYIDTSSRVLVNGAGELPGKTGFSALLNTLGTVENETDINYLGETNRFGTSIKIGAIPLIQNYKKLLYSNGKVNNSYEIEIIQSPLGNTSNEACTGDKSKRIEKNNSNLSEGVLPYTFKKENFISTSQHTPVTITTIIKYKITCLTKIEKRLNLTKDTTICKGDTITIKATSGFVRYNWPVSYKMQQLTDSIVKVYPDKDTFYIVNTITASGCMLSDTVHITVKQTPLIELTNDTSICKGDSIVLQSNISFIGYQWSNGATSSAITVKEPDIYYVKAVAANGCYSSDTFRLLSLFDTPVVSLRSLPVLCINQTDTLDAGAYETYLWNTGASSRNIKVDTKGIYSVVVTDINGCKGSGSVNIESLIYPPSAFLPSDTSICNNQTVEFSGSNLFQSYLWNNGSNSQTITVSQPGLYTLKVSDRYNCYGTDSLIVSLKNCPNTIYFPNAFTPDANGLNDVYKPIVEGNLVYYQFCIYNKWGEEVFSTKNPSFAWNGSFKKNPPIAGVYVWRCSFQFRNEPAQITKGTVTLIK